MLKNLELAVGTDTYIPEVEGIVPFHNCDSDEDTKELDAIIVTIDNDTNTIQELKAFQKTLRYDSKTISSKRGRKLLNEAQEKSTQQN